MRHTRDTLQGRAYISVTSGNLTCTRLPTNFRIPGSNSRLQGRAKRVAPVSRSNKMHARYSTVSCFLRLYVHEVP